jgi:hypothetical protein
MIASIEARGIKVEAEGHKLRVHAHLNVVRSSRICNKDTVTTEERIPVNDALLRVAVQRK